MESLYQSRECRCVRRAVLGVLLVLAQPVAVPAQNGEWKLDVLRLRNGKVLKGLLVEETPDGVRFQCVRQSPGKRTFVFSPAVFFPAEIDRIDKLAPRERDELTTRLKALDSSGDGERQRMSDLELQAAPWGDQPRGGLAYRSEQFELVSNANDEIVRRAAVRLEDIYAAYTSHLPPRSPNSKPTRIVLVESVAEYQKMVKDGGTNILNPAFFDRTHNQVYCASDLQKMGKDLALMREAFAERRKDLDSLEAELDKLYGKGKVPVSFRQPILESRRKLVAAAAANEQAFGQATQHLFQVLYHEAFHAYLDNFVYPPEQTEIPRWLNEGLAQIFESAIVEAGELRVGHADENRLTRAKNCLRGGGLVPLADLLRAGPREFLVQHGGDKQAADRHYLTAWALAFYLTFDRHLLGTNRLDRYATDTKRGADPLEAFQLLIEQPLPEFEKSFQQYLANLRPDGTVTTTAPK